MVDRLSWWVIPGALIVLARVATLVGGDSANDRAALDASANLDPVVLQDATGHRSVPVSWSATAANAFVLALPAGHAGERATVTLWRRRAGEVEATAWLTFTAKVRDDGTIPIGGVDAGQYDVRATFAGNATCSARDVAAPGECALQAAPVR